MTAKKRTPKVADDGIPHGLRGYRAPYNHRCEVCRAGWAGYVAERRAARKAEKQKQLSRDKAASWDELQAKREAKNPSGATESDGSVPNPFAVVGKMEKAVIEECANLERAKTRPTLVIAARNLAKIVDTPSMSSIHTSTTKQIMAILTDLHGDADKAKTGKRKSGGRLATVGALTKVNRQGA